MPKTDGEHLFELLTKITRQGLENTLQVFYGVYRGQVTDIEDPDGRGRIQVKVGDLGQLVAPNVWIPPMFDMAGNKKGFFFPPELGDWVRVVYHMGDPRQPFAYLGGWFGTEDQAKEFTYTNGRPEKRGIITRMGQAILFSDEPGNEYLRLVWHKPDPSDPAVGTTPQNLSETADRTTGESSFFEMNKDGSVQLLNKNGAYLMLDAAQESVMVVSQQGHAITMTPEGISLVDKDGNQISLINGQVSITANGPVNVQAKEVNMNVGGVFLGSNASASAVLGEALVQYLATHTHPTGVGPSGPPIVPPTPSLLSKSVKVKS